MQFAQSREPRQIAHRLIPGGCHTYAKGDDRHPRLAPGFIDPGKECLIPDVVGPPVKPFFRAYNWGKP